MAKRIFAILAVVLVLLSTLTIGVSAAEETCLHPDAGYEFDDNCHYLHCPDCYTTLSSGAHVPGEYYLEGDYHLSRCVVCSMEIEGHPIVYGEPIVIRQPTCTKEGLGEYYCNECGQSVGTVVLAIGSGEGYCDYFYQSAGTQYHKMVCRYCSKEAWVSEHTWNSGTVVVQPSGDANGLREYKCTLCDQVKTEVIDYIDIEQLVKDMSADDATDLLKKLYERFGIDFKHNSDLMRYYLARFVEVSDNISEYGKNSIYYSVYGKYYEEMVRIYVDNSVAYNQGYNDAISSVVDTNPIQGFFQGMWSGVVLFVTTIADGIGIGGISLMSVLVTAVTFALLLILLKVVRG